MNEIAKLEKWQAWLSVISAVLLLIVVLKKGGIR